MSLRFVYPSLFGQHVEAKVISCLREKSYENTIGMRTVPIITLLSDFGLKDPYVAEMKAVILSICPEARLVDISHEIEKFNIRMGAFVLASATPYFPKQTIHVAVVDPGVGTKRRPIIVETQSSFYVGPDNGVLMLAARKEGIRHVYHVTSPRFMRSDVSKTFHGRDVFAPSTAHLAKGRALSAAGPEIHDYVLPAFAKPHVGAAGLSGEILYIDDFGNLVSNISIEDLKQLDIGEGGAFVVEFKRRELAVRLCSAYGDVPVGSPLAIIGSSDFLEFSVNQGNAAEVFGVTIGERVLVSSQSRVLD
jgi:hypothetical protein